MCCRVCTIRRPYADGDHKHVFMCQSTVEYACIPKLGRHRQEGLELFEFSLGCTETLGLKNSKNMKYDLAKTPFQTTV